MSGVLCDEIQKKNQVMVFSEIMVILGKPKPNTNSSPSNIHRRPPLSSFTPMVYLASDLKHVDR
jgi:hypothetical protein